VAEIAFDQLVYSTIEDNGLAQPLQMIQPQLLLSIPSSFDITIQVNTDSFNATAGGPAGGYQLQQDYLSMHNLQVEITFLVHLMSLSQQT